jgi:hypothetical protein
MRPLIIGPEEKAAIKTAIETARSHPLLVADVMRLQVPDKDHVTLADRRPEHDRPPSEHVALPYGYHVAISFEEQPAGMCLHLSVSVERRNKLPNPAASGMIFNECLEAVGRDLTTRPCQTWVEEFLLDGKPGGLALNAVYVIAPAAGGHA